MKLVKRTREPSDEERLGEIVWTFKECNQTPTPELVSERFYYETRRVPPKWAVLAAIK